MRRMLEIKIQEFDLENLNMADIFSKLDAAYGCIGRFDESISKCKSALNIIRCFRGPCHLDTAIMHYNIRITHIKQDHFRAARINLVKSHRIYAEFLGEDHFNHIRQKSCLNQLQRWGARGGNIGGRQSCDLCHQRVQSNGTQAEQHCSCGSIVEDILFCKVQWACM